MQYVIEIFLSLQVLGSEMEYHFVHKALPHARSKRSVPHMRKLKVDPLVSEVNNHDYNGE